MRNALRVLVLAAVMVALPLRGYAALTLALCDSHHGMPAASQVMDHGASHEGAHEHDVPMQGHGGDEPLASACSLCSACCVNATAVSESSREVVFAPQRAARIPYFDAPSRGVFHKLPVPPPLAAAR
jgi:hypothetical protein